MNFNRNTYLKKRFFVLASLPVGILIYLGLQNPQQDAMDLEKNSSSAEQIADAIDQVYPESTMSFEELPEEVKASRRMVLAHSSLRSVEVDDPDSQTNIGVKQELITRMMQNVVDTDSQER